MFLGAKLKLALGALVIVAFAGASYAVYQWGVSMGVNKERQTHAQAVLKWQNRTTKVVNELERTNARRQEKVREAIQEIRRVLDESGCTDADIPDAIFERLHSNYSGPR